MLALQPESAQDTPASGNLSYVPTSNIEALPCKLLYPCSQCLTMAYHVLILQFVMHHKSGRTQLNNIHDTRNLLALCKICHFAFDNKEWTFLPADMTTWIQDAKGEVEGDDAEGDNAEGDDAEGDDVEGDEAVRDDGDDAERDDVDRDDVERDFILRCKIGRAHV